MKHRIYPVITGKFTVSFGGNDSIRFPAVTDIPSFVFIIESREGEIILVDTGFDLNHIPGPDSHGEKEGGEDLPAALRSRGFDPSRIDTIIQTHLHWDHTGGIGLLNHAEIIVQASEIEGLFSLMDNEETSFCPAHWTEALDRFRLIDGTCRLRPGIELIRSGRHTEGHQVVRVETEKGTAVLLGDSPFTYEWLWTLVPDDLWVEYKNGRGKDFFWPRQTWIKLRQWYEANRPEQVQERTDLDVDEIKKLGDIHIFSHDPELRKINYF